MDLTNQTVSGINEVHLQDSLNALLLKLKVSMEATSVAPSSSDLIVYVDKAPSTSPTTERKQYVFNLTEPLRYYNQLGDELVHEYKIVDNDVSVKTVVNRIVGVNEEGNYLLNETLVEELDEILIELFEGENYIYTNYENASITVIYPKDNEMNKFYLNAATYFQHKQNNSGEFSLDDIYFKDAFTQSGDKLNLEVDNINIECMTSKNNKFSLDSDGNLTVNSITYGSMNTIEVLDMFHPIGSIYMSVNNVSPATLFGGTWEQWGAGRVPVGVDSTQTEFNTVEKTGGEKTHALTVSEMPSHRHGLKAYGPGLAAGSAGWRFGGGGSLTATDLVTDTGGNTAHNNIQPYITCYMWKRTA